MIAGIKYYTLGSDEEPPEAFCAVRNEGGEPKDYMFYGPEDKLDELVGTIRELADSRGRWKLYCQALLAERQCVEGPARREEAITDVRDAFVSAKCGRACVEIDQDGDFPTFPDTWMWGVWYDGELMDGTGDFTSLEVAVAEAAKSVTTMARELEAVGRALENAQHQLLHLMG